MSPLHWQIIVTILGAAFTVGAVSRGLTAGINELKVSLGELRQEVHAQGDRISSLEVRVAVLETPFKAFLGRQHGREA